MNIKKTLKTFPPPFSTHKVTLKSLSYDSPSRALRYLMLKYEDINMFVLKQRSSSITIEIHCGANVYEQIKLNFVTDMGRDFLWKD